MMLWTMGLSTLLFWRLVFFLVHLCFGSRFQALLFVFVALFLLACSFHGVSRWVPPCASPPTQRVRLASMAYEKHQTYMQDPMDSGRGFTRKLASRALRAPWLRNHGALHRVGYVRRIRIFSHRPTYCFRYQARYQAWIKTHARSRGL